MAGQDAPTLDESVSRIGATLAQIEVWLSPASGIGVARLPPDLAEGLTALAAAAGGAGRSLGEIASALTPELGHIHDALSALPLDLSIELAGIIAEAAATVYSGLPPISTAVSAQGTALATVLSRGLADIAEILTDVAGGATSGLECICYALKKLLGLLQAAVGGNKLSMAIDWQELLKELKKALDELLPELLGAKPQHESPAFAWLAMLEAAKRWAAPAVGVGLLPAAGLDPLAILGKAVTAMLGPGATAGKPALSAVLEGMWSGAGEIPRMVQDVLRPVTEGAVRWFTEVVVPDHIDPEQVVGRLPVCASVSMGAGLAAHFVSMLLSADILGTVDLNASGLAAMVADFAGFAPFTGALTGEFYRAYVRQPWGQYMNSLMTPELPGVGDILRYHYKSRVEAERFPDMSAAAVTQLLAYHGFSADWAKAAIADSYVEPRYRELDMMSDTDELSSNPDWLLSKLKLAGYSDRDAEIMQDALWLRSARTYRNGVVTELLKQARGGFLTSEDLDGRLDALGFRAATREWVVREANLQYETTLKMDALAELKLSFSRAEIDADELRQGLDDLGIVFDRAEVIHRMELLKRYRAKPLLRPDEETREVLAVWRSAFRAGVVAEDAYRSVLALAGLAEDLANLYLALDRQGRDATIAGHLRSYELPGLREEVLSGRLGLSGYEGRLAAVGFPEALTAAEVGYVKALKLRQDRQRVERYQLADCELAYQWGLCGRSALQRLYAEAGRTAAEIAIRFTILDTLRAKYASRSAARPAAGGIAELSPAERQAQTEWNYVTGVLTAAALMLAYQQLGLAPDKAAARLAVLMPLRT